MNRVSIIIPIYNVSRFIERCADSLMRQTLNEVEYIFVNDATPDNSMELLRGVIARYPARAAQVKIVEHEHNKGLPAARNTGLAVATGEYIFHCDSDDYVEPDMLECLYNAAREKSADVVWCDWFLTFARNERYMKQPAFDTSMEAVKAMLSGAMKFTVWNKLVRRSLYKDNNIEYPAGYGMGEDMTTIMLFACAENVAYVPKALYHYVKLNTSAYTQTYSPRHIVDLQHNVKRAADFLKGRFGDRLDAEIAYLKLDVKFPYLISSDKDNYRTWHTMYPEANAYIGKNKSISMRSRLLQWCACKKLYFVLKLHYFLLHKVVYGIIYK